MRIQNVIINNWTFVFFLKAPRLFWNFVLFLKFRSTFSPELWQSWFHFAAPWDVKMFDSFSDTILTSTLLCKNLMRKIEPNSRHTMEQKNQFGFFFLLGLENNNFFCCDSCHRTVSFIDVIQFSEMGFLPPCCFDISDMVASISTSTHMPSNVISNATICVDWVQNFIYLLHRFTQHFVVFYCTTQNERMKTTTKKWTRIFTLVLK